MPAPPPAALKLLPGLEKGSPGLSQGESETVKTFMALRSCLAVAAIVAINLSSPEREGDAWGQESQGTVEHCPGAAPAEPIAHFPHFTPA